MGDQSRTLSPVQSRGVPSLATQAHGHFLADANRALGRGYFWRQLLEVRPFQKICSNVFSLYFFIKILVQSPSQGSEYVATFRRLPMPPLARLPRYQGSEFLYRPVLLGNVLSIGLLATALFSSTKRRVPSLVTRLGLQGLVGATYFGRCYILELPVFDFGRSLCQLHLWVTGLDCCYIRREPDWSS